MQLRIQPPCRPCVRVQVSCAVEMRRFILLLPNWSGRKAAPFSCLLGFPFRCRLARLSNSGRPPEGATGKKERRVAPRSFFFGPNSKTARSQVPDGPGLCNQVRG